MPSNSISSVERFDALRAAHPDLGFSLYAQTPGGVVTLEVLAPDGQVFTWKALTAEAAMNTAFPNMQPRTSGVEDHERNGAEDGGSNPPAVAPAPSIFD